MASVAKAVVAVTLAGGIACSGDGNSYDADAGEISILECFVGDFFADCGGTSEPTFGCLDDGTCTWFVGGVTAAGFRQSPCSAAELCCRDSWPFQAFPSPNDWDLISSIEAQLDGFGTIPWNATRAMALDLAADDALTTAGPNVVCNGPETDFEGSPCQVGASLEALPAMQDTFSITLRKAFPDHGWHLWIEAVPQAQEARACMSPYTDDFNRRCFSDADIVCATSGQLTLNEFPDSYSNVSDLMGRLSAEFPDGIEITAEF